MYQNVWFSSYNFCSCYLNYVKISKLELPNLNSVYDNFKLHIPTHALCSAKGLPSNSSSIVGMKRSHQNWAMNPLTTKVHLYETGPVSHTLLEYVLPSTYDLF